VSLLRAAGWLVAVARADSAVEQVWAELGRPGGALAPAGAREVPA
jgi:hypothetical protein